MGRKAVSYFYITVAAVLWGVTGFFTKTLTGYGFTQSKMNLVRNMIAALIIGAVFFITDRGIFKIRSIKDFLGIASIAVFGYCTYGAAYVVAINETSVGVAGALFYTYPAFVLVLSRFMFGEKITPKKVAVIVITTIGCLFVSGALETKGASYSASGIFFGVVSGFTFALYNVLGKKYLSGYSAKTVTFYLFFVAIFVFSAAANPVDTISKVTASGAWLSMAGFAIAISILPYLLHLKGLEHVEASKASIISTTEPISAMLLGCFAYNESPTPLKIAGIALIVGSVCLMSSKIGEGAERQK